MITYRVYIILFSFIFQYVYSAKMGPYYLSTNSIDKCKPTIAVDEKTAFDLEMKVKKVNKTFEEYYGTVTYPADVQFIELVIWGEGDPLLEKKVKFGNPCINPIFSGPMRNLLQTDHYCHIKAGKYKLHSINVNEMSHKISNRANYGTVTINVEMHSKDGAVGCIMIIGEYIPLTA